MFQSLTKEITEMKKYTTVLCALTLACGMTSALLAADYGNTSGGASGSNSPSNPTNSVNAPGTPAIPTITGTVQRVDATNNSLKVKDNSGTVQMIKVDSSTQITRDGNVVQLSELHQGDVVVIKNANSTM
jgi:hypothetical protein